MHASTDDQHLVPSYGTGASRLLRRTIQAVDRIDKWRWQLPFGDTVGTKPTSSISSSYHSGDTQPTAVTVGMEVNRGCVFLFRLAPGNDFLEEASTISNSTPFRLR
jgi:hypothetical protein